MDQEKSLVGLLTKLEPTQKFRRFQQIAMFYNKKKKRKRKKGICPPGRLSAAANAITK